MHRHSLLSLYCYRTDGTQTNSISHACCLKISQTCCVCRYGSLMCVQHFEERLFLRWKNVHGTKSYYKILVRPSAQLSKTRKVKVISLFSVFSSNWIILSIFHSNGRLIWSHLNWFVWNCCDLCLRNRTVLNFEILHSFMVCAMYISRFTVEYNS